MTDSIQKEIKEVKQDLKEWDELKYCSINPEHVRKFLDLLESQQEVIEQLQESVRYWQDDAKRLEGISIRKEAFITSIGKELEQKDAEIKKLNETLNGYEIVSDLYASKIEQQAEEIRKLQEIIESQDNVWMRNMQLAMELEEKLEENKQFSEVLEWYAGDQSWGTFEEAGLFIGDGGERARNILSSIGGKNETPKVT